MSQIALTSLGCFDRTVRVVSLLLYMTLAETAVFAQYSARIGGSVLDSSGAAIAGATITVTDQETNRSRQATTGADGTYSVSGLPPGRYTISASFTGFQSATLTDILVRAEAVTGQNITLQPGSATQTVTVSASTAPELQTENADQTGTLSRQALHDLPQIGRDPYELLRLTPGVFGDGSRSGNGNSAALPNTTGPGGSNLSIFQTENQVPISSNGQRLSDNNYTLDGVSTNSLTWGGASVLTPNQESVKEIHVVTSGYEAQYGRNSGATVEVVSQNGTDQFHGSAHPH